MTDRPTDVGAHRLDRGLQHAHRLGIVEVRRHLLVEQSHRAGRGRVPDLFVGPGRDVTGDGLDGEQPPLAVAHTRHPQLEREDPTIAVLEVQDQRFARIPTTRIDLRQELELRRFVDQLMQELGIGVERARRVAEDVDGRGAHVVEAGFGPQPVTRDQVGRSSVERPRVDRVGVDSEPPTRHEREDDRSTIRTIRCAGAGAMTGDVGHRQADGDGHVDVVRQLQLDRRRLEASGHDLPGEGVEGLDLVVGDEAEERLADQLIEPVAQDPARGDLRIEDEEARIAVDQPDLGRVPTLDGAQRGHRCRARQSDLSQLAHRPPRRRRAPWRHRPANRSPCALRLQYSPTREHAIRVAEQYHVGCLDS